MKTLTKNELIKVLSELKGPQLVTIETRTIPKLRSGNPFNNLVKVSTVTGVIGFNYENSVNVRRVIENKSPDFKSLSRAWGRKSNNIINHGSKKYLELRVEKSQSDFFDGETRISLDKISQWQYNHRTRQRLNKPVIIRDYSLDNVFRIKINNIEYRVV